MMFPHTVSVFNTHESEDGEIITENVLKHVLMVIDENTSRNKLGLVDADTVQLYVPRHAKATAKYIDAFSYEELSVDSLKDFYTFKKGDYIAFGEVTLGGVSINEFKNKFGNLYEITGVTDYNYGGLKHIYVSAK